ncbi:ABC-F family ATP-binding cassette domain-containing protein [Photobacterium sp. TY1-4]|uniref:ABC-F family ATP-binding cassette domain-containing protein n=1 Tax=Photobacterium sp. TY1-4 TaxID=2899122 RepID=UPI0021C229B1|nr:ABC-F family ATP-binding cassette domain-containing protein [Photobacterium sp. TY1-4]UXI03485.1 ATP-binding cassette domain-containing protein [Photobacterium sp. TY1-4]
MSTLLTAQSISYHVTSGSLLEAVSFTLNQGDRIGLIGHNGCGKSTLLKLLDGTIGEFHGQLIRAGHCLIERVEQHLPAELNQVTMLDAVIDRLPPTERLAERWRAEVLLADMGFTEQDWSLTAGTLSGGQHTRLLLARALIRQPDLLLLDEPSNHMDLPTLLWLETFLIHWKGSFVLVSHDQYLLDRVTNCTWIMRDKQLQFFRLPCSQARQALAEQDRADEHRHLSEQKEIDRLEKSAKRLATWGKVYDNEDLARKAKQMDKRVDRLKDSQTQLTAGTPWQLTLKGESLPANRLLSMTALEVRPAPEAEPLFEVISQQLKSGDRVAILGRNGSGKSSLLRLLWQHYQDFITDEDSSTGRIQTPELAFHPQLRLGYYDQRLAQLQDQDTLLDTLRPFAPLTDELRKMALISAGFAYIRHQEPVATLSGGERSRLLFVGLTLAKYHLLFLDEPTNHLDLEGKEELAETLQTFAGGCLLVSHDRALIEQSCNRFWLVHDGKLEEWHDLAPLYERLAGHDAMPGADDVVHPAPDFGGSVPVSGGAAVIREDERLLERLVTLETWLTEDQARKAKHQKPKLQQAWRDEIEQINHALGLV